MTELLPSFGIFPKKIPQNYFLACKWFVKINSVYDIDSFWIFTF